MKKEFRYGSFPQVSWKNYSFLKKRCWDDIDAKIEEELGLKGVAVPSVRAGICWVLEYFNYRRSQNHLLVPKYLSRCILNAISRYALPIEEVTSSTCMALIVDQFGFRQDIGSIEKEVLARNLIYLEDNTNSIDSCENFGKNSCGKLIGFSKLLPVLKGGMLMSANKDLLSFFKKKREEKQAYWYSWFILMVLSWFRHKKEKVEYSALVDLAYEAYLQSPRDNRIILNNFWLGLDMVEKYVEITQKRLKLVNDLLGKRIIYPDADRLTHSLLMPFGNNEAEIKEVFHRNNFVDTVYHFDTNKNIFSPNYKRVFLIPLNPTIPIKAFSSFIEKVSKVIRN